MVRLVLRLAHGQCRTEPAACVHRLRTRWSRRLTPRNVDGMFAAVAGILLGLAISFGPLISWDARLSIVGEQMIAAFSAGTQALLLKIPVVQDTPDVVETFSAIVASNKRGLERRGVRLPTGAVDRGSSPIAPRQFTTLTPPGVG